MMRRRLTGLRPLQRRALRLARRIEHLSAKVAGAHGVVRDPGVVSVRRARPTERPPGADLLARVPAPAPEAAPALAPVVDVDDGFRIEAPVAVAAPARPRPALAPPSPRPALARARLGPSLSPRRRRRRAVRGCSAARNRTRRHRTSRTT